jgi:hypothetical protein
LIDTILPPTGQNGALVLRLSRIIVFGKIL